MGLSVVGLLAAGHRILGEPITRRSALAAAAIVAGIAVLAVTVPTSGGAANGGVLAAVLAGLGLIAVAPLLPRRRRPLPANALAVAAGTGYVLVALATTLLDSALGHGAWWPAVGWLALGGASAGAAGITEMSAFRLAPATVVAPMIFAMETVAPALLAPIVGTAPRLERHLPGHRSRRARARRARRDAARALALGRRPRRGPRMTPRLGIGAHLLRARRSTGRALLWAEEKPFVVIFVSAGATAGCPCCSPRTRAGRTSCISSTHAIRGSGSWSAWPESCLPTGLRADRPRHGSGGRRGGDEHQALGGGGRRRVRGVRRDARIGRLRRGLLGVPAHRG